MVKTNRIAFVRRHVPYDYDMPLDKFVAELTKAAEGMDTTGRVKPTVEIRVTQRYGDWEIDVMVVGREVKPET